MQGAWNVFVSGRYAYIVSVTSDSLEIIDISDPANPKHIGKILDGAGGASLNGAQDVYVSGKYAYVVNSVASSLEIIDISVPTNPRHVGKLLMVVVVLH